MLKNTRDNANKASRPQRLGLSDELKPNTPLKMDGLEFLSKLPEESIPVAFFDPQFRGVYDKLQYGNEGVSRGRKRFSLEQMDDTTIVRFIEGIQRSLIPSGHLFLWVDKFHLVEGVQPWIENTSIEIVDMITWSKKKMGMGYRSRQSAEYCIVLQKPPRRAKGVWKAKDIVDVQFEAPLRSWHPHAKPVKLQGRLIGAVSDIGDYVIDPAAGSFSVLEAALNQGRTFLGCDLNECEKIDTSNSSSKTNRTTEYEMSVAVLQILRSWHSEEATLAELRSEIPKHIELTEADNEYSGTRPGERRWEQLLRNIQSHHNSPNNFIHLGYLRHIEGGGYAITDAGRDFIDSLG